MSWCPWAGRPHQSATLKSPISFLKGFSKPFTMAGACCTIYGFVVLSTLSRLLVLYKIGISSLCKRAEIDRAEPLWRDSSVAVEQYPYFIPSSPVKPSNEETGASAQVSTEHNISSWSDGIETSNQVTICYGWDLCRHFLLLRPLAREMVCLMQDFFWFE